MKNIKIEAVHNGPLPDGLISPKEELIAYETLWAMEGMTEAKMAKKFKNEALPSLVLKEEITFIPTQLIESVAHHLDGLKDSFSVLIHGDYQYPEQLRAARYPAKLLYCKGDMGLFNSRCLSIVGPRQCSSGGLLRAERLTKLLVKEGFTIVSGLAEGVDTVALKTAIREGGHVIAVIGTPLNEYFPKQNRELQNLIAKEHLLVSQVPFYRHHHSSFEEKKRNFPKRNEVMSAISEGTIIIEAKERSGTLTQAKASISQKRKLFILDSCFQNKSTTWPVNYEKKGGIRVKDVPDILERLVG